MTDYLPQIYPNMKMPKAEKRGDSYRMSFMHDGERYRVTRDTAKECERWVMLKMLELKTQEKNKSIGRITFLLTDLFDDYLDKVGKHKKTGLYIERKLKIIKRDYPNLVALNVGDITPKDLTAWRNSRLKQVSAGTVLREISLLSAIFSYAQKELFIINNNPFAQVSKPKEPKSRNRRISNDEIKIITDALQYEQGTKPTEPRHYVAWCFLFAIETAMRRGEILQITRDNIYDDYIHLPDTKNGESRNVPLLNSAKELLKLIDHNDNKLIPHTTNSFKKSWERGLNRSGIKDLNFHDTRHEAITRFVELRKIPVEILAKITGHKTISILINTYYNPTASDISKMLNGS